MGDENIVLENTHILEILYYRFHDLTDFVNVDGSSLSVKTLELGSGTFGGIGWVLTGYGAGFDTVGSRRSYTVGVPTNKTLSGWFSTNIILVNDGLEIFSREITNTMSDLITNTVTRNSKSNGYGFTFDFTLLPPISDLEFNRVIIGVGNGRTGNSRFNVAKYQFDFNDKIIKSRTESFKFSFSIERTGVINDIPLQIMEEIVGGGH